MISVSKDDNDRIIGYIEWRQVGQSGFDKFQGEYVWINDFWIHEDHRNGGIFRQLVNAILFKAPDAKWCYFQREKYKGRMSKLYTREHFMNFSSKSLVAL